MGEEGVEGVLDMITMVKFFAMKAFYRTMKAAVREHMRCAYSPPQPH